MADPMPFNPFIFGSPVPTGKFYGRREQAYQVFSRLRTGQSTALVGEPHIGKSSLLRYIADDNTRHQWIDRVFQQYVFVDFDCHLLPPEFSPAGFWKYVLDEVLLAVTDDVVHQQCATAAENLYDSFTLERLFKFFGKRGFRIVLLIDEFDSMLYHPRFATAEYMGSLRSFATRTDALIVITASRLSIEQMHRSSTKNNSLGSPFFNHMIEVRLPNLTSDEITLLIDSTLEEAGGKIKFDLDDRVFLDSLAGRQPFLIQTACAVLFDALLRTPEKATAHEIASHEFHAKTEAHFKDLDNNLDANYSQFILNQKTLDRVGLREQMISGFDLEEIQLLCNDLGVDYEDIGGDGKTAKAAKLINYCDRRGRTSQLVAKCRQFRPDLPWQG